MLKARFFADYHSAVEFFSSLSMTKGMII